MKVRTAGSAIAVQPMSALETLFEGVPFQIGISEMTPDQDMLLVSVNPAAAAALGRPVSEIEGKKISELGLAGPGKGVWLAQYRQALDTGEPVNFEQPSGVPGSDQWWEITLTHIGSGPSGQPRFAYIVQDVSQRKRDEVTQAALYRISEAAQSEPSLPLLFKRIHEIIGTLLPAKNFFVALHDKASNKVNFPYHVDEYDAPPVSRTMEDGTLSGRVISLGQSLLFTPDTPNEGVYKEVRIIGTPSLDWLGVPLKTKTGTIGALVVQSYDGNVRYQERDKTLLEFVSGQVAAAIERKQAEDAVRLSESRLEEAQRLVHLGSWHWDLHSGKLSWSDELCRIYGVDPAQHAPSFEDFLGRIHPDERDDVTALVARALQDAQRFSHESRIVRPSGEVRTILDECEVLVDAHGAVTGMAGACLDVTVRKRGELLEQDRSAILELVAHDAPLSGILARTADALEHQRPDLRACLLLLKHGQWLVGAAPSFPEDFHAELQGLGPAEVNASIAAAGLARGPVLVADVASDPDWSESADLADLWQRHRVGACCTVAILSAGGGVLGILALISPTARDAPAEDLKLLESMSRLAAVAIEQRQLTEDLFHQAHHDSLTGLPNRQLFQDRLHQALALAKRKEQQVAVIYMDMDRIKQINDTLGHSSGDDLLVQTATRLGACIRNSDTLARLGGDEFTVVLTELGASGDAMRAANQLMEAMRAPFIVGGRELFVTMSLGISIFPDDGSDAETLMVNADVAMYRAKELGRDNFQWFAAEMNVLARERMELEGQLRHALTLEQLSLVYQPQCSAIGEILGFEALMRWHHPTLGNVPPDRFIPLAEDSGLIVPMGEWALRTACAQAVHWRQCGHPALRMSVNVSAAQFKRPDWVDTVRRALRDTGLAPEALELEITESLLLQGVKETSANLFELRALGVGVAIDDFGTGYSSLSYLHKLPISSLKIDQSFVREIGIGHGQAQEDAPIIRTIIALAHNLGMSVVAEGVETPAQRELLIRLGCEYLQGYLLHYPLSVAEAQALLDQRPSRG